MKILIYGLQRSGTNLLEQILIQSYKDIKIINNNRYAKNPLNKHFRPHSYQDKIHNLYKHKLPIKSFDSFISYLTEIPDHFIIVSKDPYSWFVSYSNWAQNNPHQYHPVDFHFSEEYELFYSNWITFSSDKNNIIYRRHRSNGNNGKVIHFVRYIDLLEKINSTIKILMQNMGLNTNIKIELPEKVPYSKRFTKDTLEFYRNKLYLEFISDIDKQIISQTVTKNTFSKLGYDCIT